MNKDNVKDYLPLIQAMAEGKTIQFFIGDKWKDVEDVSFEYDFEQYRIKPEVEYVPYENTEELIENFCKRRGINRSPMGEPPIWIFRKNGDFIAQIIGFYHGASGEFVGIHFGNSAETLSLEELFYNYTFKDGSPIGKIKE